MRKLKNSIGIGIDIGQKDIMTLSVVSIKDMIRKKQFKNVYTERYRNFNKFKYLPSEYKGKKTFAKIKEMNAEISKLKKYSDLNSIDMIHDIQADKKSLLKKIYKKNISDLLDFYEPDFVCMESITNKSWKKNKSISTMHNIDDINVDILKKVVKSQCEKRNIDFIIADDQFASTLNCHKCGCKNKRQDHYERELYCEYCGESYDRDYNASVNLAIYGAYIYTYLWTEREANSWTPAGDTVEEQSECMNDITQMYEEIAKSIRRKLLERYSYLSDIVIH